MPLLTLVNVRNVACNRGRDNVINTEGLNVHIDYKKENRPVQSSREPKRVQDNTGSHLNILQAEERNDIQEEEEEEEIIQRPDIEAEILRNIDEDDLRLLDAQPSILNLQTHGLENIQPAGHNRLNQEKEEQERVEGKQRIIYFAPLSISPTSLRLVLVELVNCSHNNRTVMMACLQNICQSFCKEDK